ncbi:uncharacterized protein LOC128682962 isoform X2 [Plodia interpunctella]|nr:uncharacterized protein LOC128682962 isoform X2 [Plodia interpunctella]
MLEILISKTALSNKRKDILKEVAEHFTRPDTELDAEIRERLNIPPKVPYTSQCKTPFKYKDLDLETDLKRIILKHYPPPPWKVPTPSISTPDTASSSFISIITSDTTLPTPEPIPTPEPTLSETFFGLISNTVDKAIFLHVDDYALRYDTAYVELKRAVEEAMEVPVAEIKEDIAELYYNAYKLFELDILEKERIAAEIAWDKRMRKKLKRTLRRQKNFKGYETPPTPKSEISSHESYKKPPQPPCICHPQFHYNRYPKDRFGIYMPRTEVYRDHNITVTPAISIESIDEAANQQPEDAKSTASNKSKVSTKSGKPANQQPDDTKSIVSNKSKVSTKSGKKATIAD